MSCIKRALAFLFIGFLALPSWGFAEGIVTSAAGSPGPRSFSTGFLTSSSTFTPSTTKI